MAGNERSGRGGKAAEKNEKRKDKSDFSYQIPDWLPDLGREYWRQNKPWLVKQGAISNKDYPAFCRLCDLYAKWRKCQQVTTEEGSTYETTSDRGAIRIIKRPEAELELQYHKEMLNLERKFGLTPVDGKGMKFDKKIEKKSVRDRY